MICLFIVGFNEVSNVSYYILLSVVIIAVYFLVIVCVKVALKKYIKADIEPAPAAPAAPWNPNQVLNDSFEMYNDDINDYRSENSQEQSNHDQIPPSKLKLHKIGLGGAHEKDDSEYNAEKAGVSKEELVKLDRKHKSIKQNLMDKGHSRQISLNAAQKQAKSIRVSSKQVGFVCCFGIFRIGLTRFWQVETIVSAITFWGSVATVIMLPNEFFQLDTISLLLFVVVTCWWNPMFYSYTRRKAKGYKKCGLYLYWMSGYMFGFVQLLLVIWYFYDCSTMNSANLPTPMPTQAPTNIVNSTSAIFNVTNEADQDEIWIAVCERLSFANNVDFGQMTLFPSTEAKTKIVYSREYSFFQDLIMFVAILSSIMHFFPATGYLFYSAPIAFCLSHLFSILVLLFIPIIQIQNVEIWQYYFIGSEPELVNNATVEALVIFLVTFAAFLCWSGMCFSSNGLL